MGKVQGNEKKKRRKDPKMIFCLAYWGPIYKNNLRTNLRKLRIKSNLGKS